MLTKKKIPISILLFLPYISQYSDSIMAVARLDEKNFASCGKDHSVCMWNITNDGVRLIAKGTGHSSYVGALAASQKFICSASKDGILKVFI